MTLNRLLSLAFATFACSLQAHAAYFTERPEVQLFIEEIAARNNLDASVIRNALEGATPLPKVIELVKPPANPGVRSWQRYRARFIDTTRIKGGLSFWQENEATLRAAEARSGVPAEIIVSLIGVETVYGRNTGNFSALSALATLAFDYPPRAELFRRELEALFMLAREQGRDVTSYRGSYAGALGLPQFLPSSVRNFAVDGDNSGQIDLAASTADAIFSVANFLAQHGWQRDGKIVMPARISDESKARELVEAGILPTLDAARLAAGGVRSALPADSRELVTLVDLITPEVGTEYWLGFQNFYVITRYNRSSFYAMIVHDLGQVLKAERAQLGSAQPAQAGSASPPKKSTKTKTAPRAKHLGA
ncbi:lytic murein transglycosylase B [Uliginosibacterium aquaticum]|uniref:Lytic murein transglycosylase B n=1 Tax=Uliginosibacterium aquaticum TaxID=2731212 RepID=A0ABX2ICW6_9RHOO|nr:lytic murein transglycosylase B [Uliginosibacterium aquaticum]NSL54137.1 lytic murein transglycosylase B [Uliginosibacterium aquaticum]